MSCYFCRNSKLLAKNISSSSRYERKKKRLNYIFLFINFRAPNVNFLFPGEMLNFVGDKKYTRVWLGSNTHTHIHIPANIHTHTQTRRHILTHTRMYTLSHTHTHKHTLTHILTHIRTHGHAHELSHIRMHTL